MMDLFSPFDIRKVHFKNRAVMAPMVLNCAGEDVSATPAFQDFYAARARGGVGYIVLGATFVHNDGREHTLGPCEAVVVAAGYCCNPIPSPAFGEGVKVQVIGDACRARSIVEAIGEGLDAAMNIGN